MLGPFTRDKIDNWVSDFCGGDAVRAFPGGIREFAQEVLTTFLAGACEHRGVEPEDLEEPDLKHGLINKVGRLALPASVRADAPALCAEFLTELESGGRLGGGRLLGAYVRALGGAFSNATADKAKPITRPGSRIGRNDPCPCGSGKKYKKCCMHGM